MFKIFKRNKCQSNRILETNEIEYQELQERAKTGAILLDVRSPQEYKEGHLQGAISLPEYEIKNNVENKISNRNQEIILYCRSGGRSKKAYNIMRKLGYTNLYTLKGGLDEI